MSTITIDTQDFPIFYNKEKSPNYIPIEEFGRSVLIDSMHPATKYNMTQILLCSPIDATGSFDILFKYTTDLSEQLFNIYYLQVPVTIANVSKNFINNEFTQFIDEINTAPSPQFNLNELFNALPEKYTVNSVNDQQICVIKYDVVYLKVNNPPLSNTPLPTIDPKIPRYTPLSQYTVNIKKSANPIIKCKKNDDYNHDSKDRKRILPIDIYDRKDMTKHNGIRKDIIKNLDIYTTFMIFSVVVGFIIVTFYVVVILIPDSKLHVIRQPYKGGGGLWRSLRDLQPSKLWNRLRRSP